MRLKLTCYILVALASTSSVIALDPTATIITDSPVIDASLGSTVEIRCDVSSRPNDIAVEWKRESFVNCTNNRTSCLRSVSVDRLPTDQQKYGLKFVASDTYILIIKYVDEMDAGRYLCLMSVTTYNDVRAIITVRVVDKPSIDPMVTSSDKFVADGDKVVLTCGAFGIPQPQIRWTRAGNGIMPGGGFVRLGANLTISQMTSKFRGPYICTALNDIGEIHRTINLDMNFAPEVSGSPANVQQKKGYGTKLICHVDAKPTAAVSWFVNDQEVTDDSSRFSVTTYQSAFRKVISKLSIHSVSSEDYTSSIRCVASNTEDTSEVKFTSQSLVKFNQCLELCLRPLLL